MLECKNCNLEFPPTYKGTSCTKCLKTLYNYQKPMSDAPKTYEQLEVHLILNDEKLKKAKEALLAEQIKVGMKQTKMTLRDLRKVEEEGGELSEEEKDENDDEDTFKGDEF